MCFSLCVLTLTIPSCLHISHASVWLIWTDIFFYTMPHSSHELGLSCLSQRRPLSLFGGLPVTPDSGWVSTSKLSLLHTIELSQGGSRTRPLGCVVSEGSCDALTLKPVTRFFKWHSVSICVCVCVCGQWLTLILWILHSQLYQQSFSWFIEYLFCLWKSCSLFGSFVNCSQ